MRSRAVRRQAKRRMMARVKRLMPWADPKRFADNRQICSCPMCGNPRRSRWTKRKDRPPIRDRRKGKG